MSAGEELVFDRERKFLPDADGLRRFLEDARPRLTLEVHDPEQPVSYTRSTYLDTTTLDHYRSADGERMLRMRLRQYATALGVGAPPRLTQRCFLELKESRGPSRTKARVGATPAVLERLLVSRGEDEAAWASVLSNEGDVAAIRRRLGESRMAPCVTTWYRRTAWRSEDGVVRVTLDEEIAFCRPSPPGGPGDLGRPDGILAPGPDRVLEVKTCGAPPAWLDRALATLPESPRLSKFRMGMVAVYGELLDEAACGGMVLDPRMHVV